MENEMASLVQRVAEDGVPPPAIRLLRTKPKGPVTLDLTGPQGNVFCVIGTARRMLIRAGKPETAAEFMTRAMASQSYEDVLALVDEYLNVV